MKIGILGTFYEIINLQFRLSRVGLDDMSIYLKKATREAATDQDKIRSSVAEILDKIRTHGETAVREYAARFSFLLSIPAIAGAFLLEARDLGGVHMNPAALVVGFLAAGATGYGALVVLIRLVRSGDFSRFVWYLWPLSAATIGYALLGG